MAPSAATSRAAPRSPSDALERLRAKLSRSLADPLLLVEDPVRASDRGAATPPRQRPPCASKHSPVAMGREREHKHSSAIAAAADGDWQIAAGRDGCASPRSPPAAAADAISELKGYLEAVVASDRCGDDPLLASITQQHCISCAVGVINAIEDGAVMYGKGTHGLLELAASTLCSLSQRPDAHPLLLAAGTIPALVSLLQPCRTSCAVVNAASALGNLAACSAARRAARAQGAIGALARLLRPDAPGAMQAAAAGALCLLAARDPIVQDSLRYLGAIELLVELAAAPTEAVARSARYCLASLRHGNPRNEEEIEAAMRASRALARDFGRLREATEVLRGSCSGSGSGGRGGSGGGVSLGYGEQLEGDEEGSELGPLAVVPCVRHSGSPQGRSSSRGVCGCECGSARGCEDAACWEAARLRAAVEMAEAAVEAAAQRESDEDRRCRAAASLLRASTRRSVSGIDRELVRATAGAARAAVRAASAGRAVRRSQAATAAAVAAAAEAAVAKAVRCGSPVCHRRAAAMHTAPKDKHLSAYDCGELCALLSDLGWEPSDLRGLRRTGTTGAELLLALTAAAAADPACSELAAHLRVAPHKARRLRRVAAAVALFNAVASFPGQGRVSEPEMRLWLAGSGCRCAEAGRLVATLRNLLAAAPAGCCAGCHRCGAAAGGCDCEGCSGDGGVSCWEWIVGWRAVTRALELHGIDWRRALP